MTALVATDLDNTVLYSRRGVGPVEGWRLRCLEQQDGKRVGFMTVAAADLLTDLAHATTFVPVTTRVPRQFARIALPHASYAIVANGALLYVDGEPEAAWTAGVRRKLGGGASFAKVQAHVRRRCRAEFTVSVRAADDLYCYAIVRPSRLPAAFVAEESAWAAERGWRVSIQNRKMYWLPTALSKSAALAEIIGRVGADRVLAAGDSLLDVGMLLAADRGIHPAHGELFESGWSAPSVGRTAASGVFAGEEIVRWLLRESAG